LALFALFGWFAALVRWGPERDVVMCLRAVASARGALLCRAGHQRGFAGWRCWVLVCCYYCYYYHYYHYYNTLLHHGPHHDVERQWHP
jgi:hypothetical protein